jgi:riboflavin biosynthesis pyrimidine reductase
VHDGPRITWHLDRETRFPFGQLAPDPARDTPIGFPPPWPDRPWIYGVMVASANGVVAWRRRGAGDDPVRAILGGDDRHRDRAADQRLMRVLRTFGDVSVGSQTTREQPELVQTPQEPGDPAAPELYQFRAGHGLQHHPRVIVYSIFGGLRLHHRMFNTPGLEVIAVTTEAGAGELERHGAADHGLGLVVEPMLDPEGLRRAHRRLFADRGVRYLACEGGGTVLRALHGAGLLDEVFLTTTDIVIDTSAHDGVITILDLERDGAELIGEGRVAPAGGFTFRRWRINSR